MQKFARKILRTVAGYDPDYYDMYADANEAFFAQLYLAHIMRRVEEAGIRPPAAVLDAGCQTGRLAIPLAKMGFRVTGVDTSGFALRRAQRHARDAGVDVCWFRGDIVQVLKRQRTRYDLVICTEVVYLARHHRQILQALVRALRPGGLLCVSHRPNFYYLVEALRQGDVEAAARVLTVQEGAWRDSAYLNWQSQSQLRALYEQTLGLAEMAIYPIDRLVWLTGVNPSQMTHLQRTRWLELEFAMSKEAVTCARYALVIASRPLTTPR